MKIIEASLGFHCEPYRKPFGVKGHFITEKWITEVRLTDETGQTATAQGGLAPLWSDPYFAAAHTPVGANLIMASILEHALQDARGCSVNGPLELQARIHESLRRAGRGMTGRRSPSLTLLYNSLVALDHAAWILQARIKKIVRFDDLLPPEFQSVLGHRHRRLFLCPTVSHASPVGEIAKMIGDGCRVLKIKLGSPGGEEEMLRGDEVLLNRVDSALRRAEGSSARGLLLYLDINGRYWRSAHLDRLLRHCEKRQSLQRVAVLEEPYRQGLRLKVKSCPVPVAADESLINVSDIERRRELGYGAVTLKPAGKSLSLTLRMAAEGTRQGMILLVGDSSTTPALFDWNRNVAARLPTFPGLPGPLLEWNGPQLYRNWRALLEAHACRKAKWLLPQSGIISLDQSFYNGSGGIPLAG